MAPLLLLPALLVHLLGRTIKYFYYFRPRMAETGKVISFSSTGEYEVKVLDTVEALEDLIEVLTTRRGLLLRRASKAEAESPKPSGLAP